MVCAHARFASFNSEWVTKTGTVTLLGPTFHLPQNLTEELFKRLCTLQCYVKHNTALVQGDDRDHYTVF